MKDQLNPESKSVIDSLLNTQLPTISLPNQDGNYLKLNRTDTFRLVIYFYSLTGNPNKKLPKNWHQIPGANGCTLENCSFRDNYEKLIELNAIPIGISTQSIDVIKEMTLRLGIQFDILSDAELLCVNKLSIPTFLVEDKTYFKKMTIIVEKNTIKKVFYPVVSVNKHISNVLEWLRQF